VRSEKSNEGRAEIADEKEGLRRGHRAGNTENREMGPGKEGMSEDFPRNVDRRNLAKYAKWRGFLRERGDEISDETSRRYGAGTERLCHDEGIWV
jgi:hypothetical protein